MLSCVGGCCMCLRLGAHEHTQSQHAHMYIMHSTTIYDNIYILTHPQSPSSECKRAD